MYMNRVHPDRSFRCGMHSLCFVL